MLKVSTLPSGLRVATYKIDRQMSGVVAIVGAGGRYESDKEAGYSHFLEHILMSGTKSYPVASELRDSIESLGGSRSAHTSREFVTFDIDILREHLDIALQTIAEQLQNSIFNQQEIDRQKNIVGSELLRLKTSQETYINRTISEMLWPNHPLGGSSELEEKNLPAMDETSLKEFLDRHYTAPNALICIAGQIDHDEYVKKVGALFGKMPTALAPKFRPAKENHQRVIRIEPKGLKQTHVAIGFYAPSRRGNERLSARLLSLVLDRNIVTKLRFEKGLTYQISVGYNSYEDTGRFIIAGTFQPDKTKAALDELFKEINRTKVDGIEKDALERAKSRLKTSSIRTEENVASLAKDYATRTFFGYEPALIPDEIALIEKITPAEVQAVAKKFLNEDFKMMITGPKNELAELDSLYGKSSQKVSN